MNWFLNELNKKGSLPHITSRLGAKVKIPNHQTIYRQRYKIENMLDRIEVGTRTGMIEAPSYFFLHALSTPLSFIGYESCPSLA
jgi:hypothetical protein